MIPSLILIVLFNLGTVPHGLNVSPIEKIATDESFEHFL